MFYPVSISFQSFFFYQYFLIYLPILYCLFNLCRFSLFAPTYSTVFPLSSHFYLLFLICISSRISQSHFQFLLVFFWGTPILSQTNFALLLLSFCSWHILYTAITWWSLTGVTPNLLRCPGLFQSILFDFNNTVVWIIWIFPLISNLNIFFPYSLETVPRAPNTSDITVLLLSLLLLLHSVWAFPTCVSLLVFHWSLSNSKCPRISGTLPSILADLSKAGSRIILIFPQFWFILLFWISNYPYISPVLIFPLILDLYSSLIFNSPVAFLSIWEPFQA